MAQEDRHDPVKKAKLVHIITLLELGGAQENTLINCKLADRDIFDVYLLSGRGGMLDARAEEMKDLMFYPIKDLVRKINPIKDAASLIKIFLFLRKLKKESPAQPLIVHTHSSKAGILGRTAAAMARCEIVIHTVHGFGFNPLQGRLIRWFLILLERLVGTFTDFFVLVSSDNGKRGVKLGIFKPGKTSLIRSGFKTADFIQSSREKGREVLGLKDDTFTVGMAACFKPQKSPLDFVRAAKEVKDRGYNFRYVLVGDGELRSEIMKEIVQLGLGGEFILPGWVENVGDVIAAFDLLVLTSLWEGLPKVLPQALIAGVPVIATAVDGTVEVVKDGINGFLIDVNSPKSAASKIIMVSEGALDRERLMQGAKGLADEFSEEKMVSLHRDLYLKLLEEKAWKS